MLHYVGLGVLIMVVAGAFLGALLFLASRFFAVETDPRIEQILDLLPGANCGACGFGGCAAFAEAVVLHGSECHLCVPGGGTCAAAIAKIMGAEVKETEPMVAVIHCGGSPEMAPKQADYYGIQTCAAACVDGVNSPKGCLFGCLALGDCIRACPFDAMTTTADGMPHVIESKCVACGKCVAACPRNIIELHPRKKHVHVLCKSRDKGKDVRKLCQVGCIACKRCEKECKFDAVKVVDNLAVIDYEKCTNCGKCANVCPMSTIVNLRKARKEVLAAQAEGKEA